MNNIFTPISSHQTRLLVFLFVFRSSSASSPCHFDCPQSSQLTPHESESRIRTISACLEALCSERISSDCRAGKSSVFKKHIVEDSQFHNIRGISAQVNMILFRGKESKLAENKEIEAALQLACNHSEKVSDKTTSEEFKKIVMRIGSI